MSEPQDHFSESLAKLKLFDHKKLYEKGRFVDVYDSNSTWRVAKIDLINDEIVKLFFDGWSHKWDEVSFRFF